MEVFKILGKIAIEGAETANKALESVGNVAKKAGKVIAAGLAAGATAVAAVSKAALDSYADYEQLVGGVETLFKESAGIIQDYANRAFETAGLSANEYMETVTSFSASLLQSLDGDTAKAAEVANRAITDMSDNANKMGTDMSMIQNAYQGFAKQNYTMLDNLKLGYGGTKGEMERLIADAAKMTEAQEKLGITVDRNSMSFANIVNAISVVQAEMGIMGTTANEAATTIQGSLAMTKSAWQNLLTGFGDENADLGVLVDNLVNSALTAFGNMMPRIEKILYGISSAFEKIMPVIAAELPGILEQLLPGLISGAIALLNGLVAALPTVLLILIEQVPFIISQIGSALIAAIPLLLDAVKQVFQQIVAYVAVELLHVEEDFDTAMGKIEGFFSGALDTLKYVWDSVGQPIFDLVRSAVDLAKEVFAERMPQIKEFVSNCFTDIGEFWENNLKPCFDAIGNFIENVLAPVFEFVFKHVIMPAVDTAFQFIKNIWNDTLKPVFTGITDFITGVFTLDFAKAFEGLISIVDGIFGGLVSIVKNPINHVINVINSFIRGLNKLTIPDWVPGLGGKGINIPLIPELERGGILEKGQVGLLEGNGAEAVVPLDQNRAWISRVAADLNEMQGNGNGNVLADAIVDKLDDLLEAITNLKVYLNTGVLVGEMLPGIDRGLGDIYSARGRGQ